MISSITFTQFSCDVSFFISELYSTGHKRPRFSIDGKYRAGKAFSSTTFDETVLKKPKTASNVVDFSDPFAIQDLLDQLDCGKFGSVTKDIEALFAPKMQTLYPYFGKYPTLINKYFDMDKNKANEASRLESQQATQLARDNVIDLEDDCVTNDAPTKSFAIITIDSDEEDREDRRPSYHFMNVSLNRPSGVLITKDIEVIYCAYVLEDVTLQ